MMAEFLTGSSGHSNVTADKLEVPIPGFGISDHLTVPSNEKYAVIQITLFFGTFPR